jgi:hypothetical protein
MCTALAAIMDKMLGGQWPGEMGHHVLKDSDNCLQPLAATCSHIAYALCVSQRFLEPGTV